MATSPRLSALSNESGSYYEKSTRHATYNFNQGSNSLFRYQPRFPFEYYININLNRVGTATSFIDNFFSSQSLSKIMPMVKTVDMPSFKIETTALNQYNRKRLSQTKMSFEPIKMVFHDIADGETLRFWEMYYRYYFADGLEPGKNSIKVVESSGDTYSVESENNPYRAPSSIDLQGSTPSSTNTNGDKSSIQNIISDTLDNHNFGFNLPVVQDVRNLIQTIDIYQVHGGRFNEVTLVNPRISAFTHDVLNYAAGDKTLEITFMFEYEYAYYTIQNMKLGGGEHNNSSTIEQFEHGEFLDTPALSFGIVDPDFIESSDMSTADDFYGNIGDNNQTELSSVTSEYTQTSNYAMSSSSSIGNLVDITPAPVNNPEPAVITTRSFKSTAAPNTESYNPDGTVNSNTGTPAYPDLVRARRDL